MAAPDPIRAALYQHLAADATLRGLLARPPRGQDASIYHRAAPLAAPFPYVILNKQDGRPSWRFSGGRTDAALWMIKGVCSGSSASAAEAIDAAVDDLLNDARLTITGRRLLAIYRKSDVDYPEQSGADLYHHVGGIYRIVTEPA